AINNLTDIANQILAILKGSPPPIPPPSPPPSPPPIPPSALKVVAVTASGNDGNLPTNIIDGDPTTRWSSLGKGQFITLDVGSIASISEIDVAWYKGDTRTSNYVIEVSADGTTFTNLVSGISSGTTLAAEKYMGIGSG